MTPSPDYAAQVAAQARSAVSNGHYDYMCDGVGVVSCSWCSCGVDRVVHLSQEREVFCLYCGGNISRLLQEMFDTFGYITILYPWTEWYEKIMQEFADIITELQLHLNQWNLR